MIITNFYRCKECGKILVGSKNLIWDQVKVFKNDGNQEELLINSSEWNGDSYGYGPMIKRKRYKFHGCKKSEFENLGINEYKKLYSKYPNCQFLEV